MVFPLFSARLASWTAAQTAAPEEMPTSTPSFLSHQLPGFGDGPPHALGPLGEDQLRTVDLHNLAALHAHGFGHDDDDPIPSGGGHRGQADAGVAGGGLNNNGAGLFL